MQVKQIYLISLSVGVCLIYSLAPGTWTGAHSLARGRHHDKSKAVSLAFAAYPLALIITSHPIYIFRQISLLLLTTTNWHFMPLSLLQVHL